MSENRKIKFTTNKGVFVAEMFEDKAPLTTKKFIELVEKGSTKNMVTNGDFEDNDIAGWGNNWNNGCGCGCNNGCGNNNCF